MEVTIHYIKDDEHSERTVSFPFKTEATLKKHLTSLYGKSNMDNVFWDIWEEPEDEGLEEIEYDPDTEVAAYLRKRLKKGKK